MFGNFFNFQSKNKEPKSGKDESAKKGKNKKGKDNKKESEAEKVTEVIKDDDEQEWMLRSKTFLLMLKIFANIFFVIFRSKIICIKIIKKQY
jgi:hypothetical protein